MLSYFRDRAAVRATEKSLVESEAALMALIPLFSGVISRGLSGGDAVTQVETR
jgi:uncharacterized membrane protein